MQSRTEQPVGNVKHDDLTDNQGIAAEGKRIVKLAFKTGLCL